MTVQQSLLNLKASLSAGFTAVGNALQTTNAAVANKVEKVDGYGLSQENYTPEEKTKLAGLESSKFKGEFVSLVELQATFPTADVGSYANVDGGLGQEVARYIWDSNDSQWVKQAGASTQLTAAQIKAEYESNPDTNPFTDAEKTSLQEVSSGLSDIANEDYTLIFETALNS